MPLLLLLSTIAVGAETAVTLLEVSGALAEADAQQTLRRHALELGRCARRHLPATPQPLAATVTLTARRGSVRPDSVSMRGPAATDGLHGCIVPKVYLWDFGFAFADTAVTFELLHSTPPPPPPVPAAPTGPLAVPAVGPLGDPGVLAGIAERLDEDGRLLRLDADLLAVLREEDLCASAPDEFAAARCAQTAGRRAADAADALAEGWLYVRGLSGTLGTWDVGRTRFPLDVDPVLITGGLSTPDAPTLTAGRPEVRYDADRAGGFELRLPALPTLETVPLPLDDAESLARRSQRHIEGAALVRLGAAYSVPIRTAAWYAAQDDPLGWRERVVRGEARDTDRYVTLYGIDVEVIAMEFLDPATGAQVASWVAPGVDLDGLQPTN